MARELVAEGVAVGLIARDPDGLAEAARTLAGHGGSVVTMEADVTDTAALHRAVHGIADALGGLDHLVANAGGTIGNGNLTSSEDGDFAATLALNAGHAAELIRAGLPHLRAAGGGAVVIISSITGLRPAPRTAYAAAKAAEIQLAAAAAQELAPAGIRVNAVSPGSIMFAGGPWDMFRNHNPDDFAAFLATQFPSGPPGPPGRGRRRDRLPAVPAGLVGHRRQHRGGRRPDLPERPAVRLTTAGRQGRKLVVRPAVRGRP